MADSVGILQVEVRADVQKATAELKAFDDKMHKIAKGIGDVGSKLTMGLTLPIAGIAVASFKMASDMNESLNKVNTAFGDSSQDVIDFSKTTLQSFGIAQSSALEMASLFGDMGTAMGFTRKDASEMSMSMVGLAGDLASYKNVSIEVAQNALKGVFTGETESLKQLGYVMTEANLSEYALANGIKKKYSEMTQSEKVSLRYAYLQEVSKDATGDFADTSDQSANQLRMLTESVKELATNLGSALLPIFTPIITKVGEIVRKFAGMDESTKRTVLVVGALVMAIGPLLMIISKAIEVYSMFHKAMGLLKTMAMASNTTVLAMVGPYLAVIAVVALLVAGLVWAWNNVDWFRQGVMDAWDKIKQVTSDVFENVLIPIFDKVVGVLKTAWDFIYTKTKEVFEQYILPFIRDQLEPMFKRVFETIGVIVTGIFKVIEWAWQNILSPVFNFLVAYIQNVLLPVWSVIFSTIGAIIGSVFKTIGELWDKSLKPIFNGILTFLQGVFSGDWKKIWEGLSEVFKGVWEGIKTIAKAPLNWLIDGLNGFIRGINKIKIPDWVPIFGGKSIHLAEIPKLNVGTNYVPRDMVANIHKGEMVVPANLNPFNMDAFKSLSGGGQEVAQSQIIEIHFGNQIYREIINGINKEQRYANRTLIDLF